MHDSDKPHPKRPTKRRKLTRRQLFAGAGVVLAGIGIDAFFIEPNWLEINYLKIPIKNLPKSFEGYRIALASDIHWPEMIDPEFVKRIGQEIQKGKPNLLCIPGDVCDESAGYIPNLKGVLDTWTAPDGTFATLGNHDWWLDGPGVKKEIRDRTHLQLIDNDRTFIERDGEAIVLAGVGDLYEDTIDSEKALGGLDPNMPRILLSHNPDVAHDMPGDYRVDLQLSGHTHGGQIALPDWAPVVPSQYGQTFRHGLVQGRKNLVYVTRGVARWGIHARFCARPEVTFIDLVSADA